MMSRRSKIQKKVLQLYKEFLRAVTEKSGFNDNVRDNLYEASVPRKEALDYINFL